MGTFRIEIEAVGGHGCQRDKQDGERVTGCGEIGCPDCIARRFVDELKVSGNRLVSAKLIHWPGQEGSVVDDLRTMIRQGKF